MAFAFNHGDRPLSGYTIERGVGRGGFGEVYYARSDGGKEVALKYLRENPQIELRGVAHCLNLKSPYLVGIHDVKQSADGDFFVIMEYVSGPSLRDLLNSESNGLGTQKAAYFLREVCKGLSYLHDRGIVHRDLKPGNIFYEDGYVKIGDYGLAKIMAASQHSGQTVSVGTVHYMAPEVGSGNYDRTIDIYALGVMLYEMLLGRVPYSGATMGEVLMKHLTAQPAVDELPEPFPRVIRKALAKDPKERYQTVEEMVADIFSVEDLNRSVAGFEPASLSTLAARAAQVGQATLTGVPGGKRGTGVAAIGQGSSNVGFPAPPPILPNAGRYGASVEEPVKGFRARLGRRAKRVADGVDRTRVAQNFSEAAGRPRRPLERIMIGLLICAAISTAVTLMGHHQPLFGAAIFLGSVTIIQGILLGHWYIQRRLPDAGTWNERVMSVLFVAAAFVPGLYVMEHLHFRLTDYPSWIWPVAVTLLLCDWRERVRDGRRGRVSLGSAFMPFLITFIAAQIIVDGPTFAIAAMIVAASFGMQTVASIWPLPEEIPAEGVRFARRPDLSSDRAPAYVAHRENVTPGARVDPRGWISERNAAHPTEEPAFAEQQARRESIADHAIRSNVIDPAYMRSKSVRAMWMIASALLLFLASVSFATGGILERRDALVLPISVVVGQVLSCSFLFALSCVPSKRKKGLWRGIYRKAIFFSGMAMTSACGASIGLFGIRDNSAQFAALIAACMFGGLLMLMVWFIPAAAYVPPSLMQSPLKENRGLRIGRALTLAGILCFSAAIVLLPLLLIFLHSHDYDDVLPAVLIPLGVFGFLSLLAGTIVRHASQMEGGDNKLELPLRSVFLVDSVSRLDMMLDREMVLHGFRLKNKGDLFWHYARGEWYGGLLKRDIRQRKTDLRIAAYILDTGDQRITCLLDVDSSFNRPDQKMLRQLSKELNDMREALGGREANSTESPASIQA